MFAWIPNLINHPGLPWGVSALIVFWGFFALLRFRAAILPVHQHLGEAITTIASHKSPTAFAHGLEQVDAALAENPTLAPAWRSFRSTLLVSEKTGTVQTYETTVNFFNIESVGRPLSGLKIFQSIPSHLANTGLVFTFLSLVVAIHVSAGTILSSGSGPSYQAIQELFQIASFKFLTSIAGIVSAMMLSAVIRKHMHILENRLGTLANLLNKLVQEVPRETMFLEQITHANRGTETKPDVMEHLPELADSLSSQLAADLDHRLGGVIRQVTRQFIDEIRRETTNHHQTHESLFAELREDVKRDLAETKNIASTENQNLKRSVQQIERLANALQEKPSGDDPFPAPVDRVLEAIAHQGADLARRIGSPNLSATVLESLQTLSQHHGARLELALKKTVLDSLAPMQTPEFLGPMLEHIREEVENTIQKFDPRGVLEPAMSAIKADGGRILATQDEINKTLISLRQTIAQPTFVENLSHIIHEESERLLKQWHETMAPLADAHLPISNQENTGEGVPLAELQRILSEQTIVEPIVRLIHEEISHIRETIRQQPLIGPHWDDIQASVREEVRTLKDSLADFIQPHNQANLESTTDSQALALAPILQAIKQEKIQIHQQMELLLGELKGRMETMEEDWRAAIAGIEASIPDGTEPVQAVERIRRELLAESNRLSGQIENAMEVIRAELAQTTEIRITGRIDTLTSTINEGNHLLGGKIEEIKLSITDESNRQVAQSNAIIRKMDEDHGKTTHHIEDLRAIFNRLDGMTQQIREELAHASENQHQRLLQLSGDTENSKLNLEPIFKALDTMNGGMHQQMETMLASLRADTDRLTEAQQHLLEISQHANRAVVEGFNKLPAWENAMEGLNEKLGQRIETIAEIIRKEGAEIAAAQQELLGQYVHRYKDQENIQHIVAPLRQALEEEHTRVMEFLYGLKQAVSDETRFVASQHLEALRTTIAESFARNEIDLAPIHEAIDRIAACQLKGSDIETATQPLLDALQAQTDRMMKHVGQSVQSANLPLVQAMETQTGHIIGHVNQSIQGANLPLLQAVKSHISHAEEHLDHSIQSATQPLLLAIESQAGRVVERLDRTIQSATQPVFHTVETQTERIISQVHHAIQAIHQPLFHSVETQTGRVMDHVSAALQNAHLPLLQSLETQTDRMGKHLDRTIHSAIQPLFYSVETQTGRVTDHVSAILQNAHLPLLQSLETQTDRMGKHFDQTIHSAIQPLLHSVEVHAGRAMEHSGTVAQNASLTIAQSLISQKESMEKQLDQTILAATQRVSQMIDTQTGHIVQQFDHATRSATQPLLQTIGTLEEIHRLAEAQKQRINALETLVRKQHIQESETRKVDLGHIVHAAVAALAKSSELENAVAALKGQNAALTLKQTDIIIAIQDESRQLSDRFQEMLAGLQGELQRATDRGDLSEAVLGAMREETKTLENLVFAQRSATREAGLRLDTDGDKKRILSNMWSQMPLRTGQEMPDKKHESVPAPEVANQPELPVVLTSTQDLVPETAKPEPASATGDEPIPKAPPREMTATGPAIPWTGGVPHRHSRKQSETEAVITTEKPLPWSPEARIAANKATNTGITLSEPSSDNGPSEATPWLIPTKREVENQPGTALSSPSPNPQELAALIRTDNHLPWSLNRQKLPGFASQREATMSGLVDKIATSLNNKTSENMKPVTPILETMSDLLATGTPLSDPRFAQHLTDLAETMEIWVSTAGIPEDSLSGLDDDITNLASLIQESTEDAVRTKKSPVATAATQLHRRTIKPTNPLTRSPFPTEVLAATSVAAESMVSPLPRRVETGRLDSLLQQYYERGKGSVANQGPHQSERHG